MKKAKKMLDEMYRKNMDKLFECEQLLETRAGKLLKKGKPFIVVAIDEPYFPQVYRLIRQHEVKKGTWTEQCEVEFQKRMSNWYRI